MKCVTYDQTVDDDDDDGEDDENDEDDEDDMMRMLRKERRSQEGDHLNYIDLEKTREVSRQGKCVANTSTTTLYNMWCVTYTFATCPSFFTRDTSLTALAATQPGNLSRRRRIRRVVFQGVLGGYADHAHHAHHAHHAAMQYFSPPGLPRTRGRDRRSHRIDGRPGFPASCGVEDQRQPDNPRFPVSCGVENS